MRHVIRRARGLGGAFDMDVQSLSLPPEMGLVSGQVVTATVDAPISQTAATPSNGGVYHQASAPTTRIAGTTMGSSGGTLMTAGVSAPVDSVSLQTAFRNAVAGTDILGASLGREGPGSTSSEDVAMVTDEELAALDAAIGGAQRETTDPAVTAPPTGYSSVDGELQAPASRSSERAQNGSIFGLKPWQAALLAGGLLVGGILLMRR